jgi:hypothetical protein
MKKTKYRSEVAAAVHEAVRGMHRLGLVDKKTMNEFDVRSTIASDEKTEFVRLSPEGQRTFVEAILDPPEPSEGVRKAARNHRRLIREVR